MSTALALEQATNDYKYAALESRISDLLALQTALEAEHSVSVSLALECDRLAPGHGVLDTHFSGASRAEKYKLAMESANASLWIALITLAALVIAMVREAWNYFFGGGREASNKRKEFFNDFRERMEQRRRNAEDFSRAFEEAKRDSALAKLTLNDIVDTYLKTPEGQHSAVAKVLDGKDPVMYDLVVNKAYKKAVMDAAGYIRPIMAHLDKTTNVMDDVAHDVEQLSHNPSHKPSDSHGKYNHFSTGGRPGDYIRPVQRLNIAMKAARQTMDDMSRKLGKFQRITFEKIVDVVQREIDAQRAKELLGLIEDAEGPVTKLEKILERIESGMKRIKPGEAYENAQVQARFLGNLMKESRAELGDIFQLFAEVNHYSDKIIGLCKQIDRATHQVVRLVEDEIRKAGAKVPDNLRDMLKKLLKDDIVDVQMHEAKPGLVRIGH